MLGLGSAAPVQGAQTVTLRVAPDAALPFAPDELERAIALRLDWSRSSAPVVVSIVRLAGSDDFRIGIGERTTNVSLDSESGTTAARTMALLAVDLVESAEPPAPTAVRRWAGSLAAIGAPGGGWGDGKFEGQIEVRARVIGRWSTVAGAGYGRLNRVVAGKDLLVESIPFWVGVGFDLGWVDLHAVAAARLFRAGGADDTNYGGWLEVRPTLIHSQFGRAMLVVAAEFATTRVEVRPPASAPVFTSGYVTPWLGLALSSP